MSRIFITGSADGLGYLVAKWLVSLGHQVVLHARNAERGRQAMSRVPGAEHVLTADLSSVEQTRQLAEDVNAMGVFDTVVHNAGVYRASGKMILAVNTLAPYILTCLIQKPKRLIYLSSGSHRHGDPGLKKLEHNPDQISYGDSKLHDIILCKAVARKWPDVYSNAVDPGWVPTKMGGPGAPDDLQEGFRTQAWLAASSDADATVSGHYFFHKKEAYYLPEADDVDVQEKFLALCARMTGIRFPD